MPTTDKLLNIYSELAEPFVEYAMDNFYKGSTILDLVMTKKAAALKKRNLLADGTPKFPTYTGYETKLFVDNDVALTNSEAIDGIWVNVRDAITKIDHVMSGMVGNVMPANLNLTIATTKARLQVIEDLLKAGRREELKQAVNADLKKFIADMNFGIAYAVYNGKGGDDTMFPSYNTYYTYPITLPDGSTIATKPSKRQIEGLWSFVVNPNVGKLWGIDTTTYPWWKAPFFDFVVAANQPFGYASKFPTGITQASQLMSATNSMTANLPVVLDILSQAISRMTNINKKPDVILCRRELYDVVRRAKFALGLEKAEGAKEVDWLIGSQYEEYVTVDGVPVIPDDTSRMLADGTKVYACPANAFLLVNLDDIKFMAHKDYNFVATDWEKTQGIVGEFTKSIDATVKFYVVNRNAHGLIQFGDIDYEA